MEGTLPTFSASASDSLSPTVRRAAAESQPDVPCGSFSGAFRASLVPPRRGRRTVRDTQDAEDPLHIAPDGRLSHTKGPGDLLVGQAAGHVLQNLKLAAREALDVTGWLRSILFRGAAGHSLVL